MLRSVIVTLGSFMIAGSVLAQPASEVEPNNFAPGTTAVPPGLPYFAITGFIAPGDVDYHVCGPATPYPYIIPTPGSLHSAAVWTSPGIPPATEDTFLGAWLPLTLPPFVSVDDDDNPGLNSAHHFSLPFGGPPISHVVTGYPDSAFIGAHSITTPYCLVVSNFGRAEIEPNDTPPLANPFPAISFSASAREGMLSPGDVDMYTLDITAGSWVTFATYDFAVPPIGAPAPDTFIGVMSPNGVMYMDDDDGPGVLSALSFIAPENGIYTFMVSGFPDTGFVGAHAQSGPYRAVVSLCYVAPSGPQCDSIDFNVDGLFPSTDDLNDFVSVFSGGPCSTGTCNDIDFNNDGLFPSTDDINAFISVMGGGPCF